MLVLFMRNQYTYTHGTYAMNILKKVYKPIKNTKQTNYADPRQNFLIPNFDI